MYAYINELLYEKVVSHIPKEVWLYVFQSVTIKYSHLWATLTLVSKLFYSLVYEELGDVYINVQLFKKRDPSFVLSRFTKLETLRVPCFKGELVLPLLPHLKKLKIRYPRRDKCHMTKMDGGTFICGRRPSLALLNHKNVPKLKSLSYKNCCMRHSTGVSNQLLDRITKLTTNSYGILVSSSSYPSLTVLNMDAAPKHTIRNTVMSKYTNLKKVVVHQGAGCALKNYTGECMIYMDRSGIHYKVGQMTNGKKTGIWESYNRKGVCIGRTDWDSSSSEESE
jgi:hypothetical protein